MSDAVVSLGGVRVFYDGHAALDGFDLEVSAGERVALVGPSGAGKTTALRLCTAGVAPTGGSVSVLGHDLAATTPAQLAASAAGLGPCTSRSTSSGPYASSTTQCRPARLLEPASSPSLVGPPRRDRRGPLGPDRRMGAKSTAGILGLN